MNIYLELFGYLGTALVITSMMMTSVIKLRLINISGSVISMIYAVLSGTWPVVILNLSLIVINLIQILRMRKTDLSFQYAKVSAKDKTLEHFLTYYQKDIRTYFPDATTDIGEDRLVFMVFREANPVGVLAGRRQDDQLHVELDYTTPEYRDCSVAKYLFDQMKELGVSALIAKSNTPAHIRYLQKMGFRETKGQRVKIL